MERTAAVAAHRSPRAVACLATVAGAACLLALIGPRAANAQVGGPPNQAPPSSGAVAATLEQCVTSVAQSERSATFMGEMTAIGGTAKMSIRIDVEERGPEDLEFHLVSAPGLGVWRSADPKVKVYKYLKQVTNLSSPASYRALVRFRWISAKGRVIRRAERLTPRCLQPATPPEATPPGTSPPAAGAPSSSAGATGAPPA